MGRLHQRGSSPIRLSFDGLEESVAVFTATDPGCRAWNSVFFGEDPPDLSAGSASVGTAA